MGRLRMLVEGAKLTFPNAVKTWLSEEGSSVKQFAEEETLQPTAVSGKINGSTPYTYDNVAEAITRRSGEDREWVDEQLRRQRESVVAAEGAAP